MNSIKALHIIVEELRRIGSARIATSVVAQAELYYGALNKAELQQIKNHLSRIHIYPIDDDISTQFIQLMETFSLSHKLGIPDALIEATALTHNVELYTFNARDFQFITGVTLYQP